jgi:uncharacterized protein (DUF488 family)
VTVWTIGHSTQPLERFLEMLDAHGVTLVADVRRFPASRRHPHFAREALQAALTRCGLRYSWLPDLGGLRRPRADSQNDGWQNESFRGYADYMETRAFERAVSELLDLASSARAAIMCAEAAWQRCHRRLIADWLKAQGHEVIHILDARRSEPHPYTRPARIEDGRLSYRATRLFP